MRLTPASRLGIVLGHLAGGTLAATLLLAIVVIPLALAGVLQPPPGRWPVIAAILVATAVGSTGLGVVVGLVTRRLTTTVLLGVNVASASFLLGGGFTTIAFLPPFIQHIAATGPELLRGRGTARSVVLRGHADTGAESDRADRNRALSLLAGVWMLARSGIESR